MRCAIVLLRFVFISVFLGSKVSQPMDGLNNENFNIQADVTVKSKRRKKSNSKVFHYLFTCLCDGSHKHMLKFCDIERMRFQITLLNKKSPLWQENAISFCKGLDALSKRNRSTVKYEEKTRGRLRANMIKLCQGGKYMKLVHDEKDPKNLCKRTITYEIIHPYYIDKVKNKLTEKSLESEMTNMNASGNILSYISLDNLNGQDTVIIENPDTPSIMKKSEGDCRLKRKRKDCQSKSQVTPRKKRKDLARKQADILNIADFKTQRESNVDTMQNISENATLQHVSDLGNTGKDKVWYIQNKSLNMENKYGENKYGNQSYNEDLPRKQADFFSIVDLNNQCESRVDTMQNISPNMILQPVSDSGNTRNDEAWGIQNESLMNIGGNEYGNRSYNVVQNGSHAEINDQCVFPFADAEENKLDYFEKGEIENMYDDNSQHEIWPYFLEDENQGLDNLKVIGLLALLESILKNKKKYMCVLEVTGILKNEDKNYVCVH